jgi:hypothetical protein
MGKEKRIKFANKDFYRIKDINTGLYYLARHWTYNEPEQELYKQKYKYSYKPRNKHNYALEGIYFLELDEVGHFYPSRKGAERMLSEFVGCSIHDRKTTAGRIFNSKFNFVVVKSKMKLKDVPE